MTALDAERVVKAGGVAGLEAKTDAATSGELFAVTFRHPALAGRTVVRLVEESLDAAVTAEMQVLGFQGAARKEPVGRTRQRALGFPAWALVHHPKKATFALDVMRDFRKAAARARTKPGHARDAFVEIGKRLEGSVPEFLPSFWEQVGRAFLAEDATQMAAQSFEKARVAERAYKLSVDEERRAAAYLEFAAAGAIPAKSLASYAADLAAAFDAKEALARFVRVNVQRIKAGVPPWTGMAKELGKLAKAAKDTAAEAAFIDQIASAAALKQAPPDFWLSYRARITQVAAASPEVLRKLTFLFPTPRGQADFTTTWLELLDSIGAIERLSEGTSEEIARFVSALTLYVHADRSEWKERTTNPRYSSILARLAPGLIASGTPVDLRVTSWLKWGTYLSDVLEAALELGLSLAPMPEGALLNLRCAFEKDPVKLTATLPELVQDGVDRAFGHDVFHGSARGKAALIGARRTHLLRRIEALSGAALPDFMAEVTALTQLKSEYLTEFPEVVEALARVSPGAALARSLRGGVYDELSWPDFEAALAELGPSAEVEQHGTLAHPILRAGSKAIVFDGPKRLKDYDLPGAAKDLTGLMYLDGDLFIEYRDGGQLYAVWASKPKAPFETEQAYRGNGIHDAVPLPGGGVTLGEGPALHAGDTPKKVPHSAFVSDGERFWSKHSTYERFRLLELDPRTGRKGRASWPDFVREASEATDGYQIQTVFLQPLPNARGSLFGLKDGLVGYYRRVYAADRYGGRDQELVRIDGVRWMGPHVDMLADWPGLSKPVGVRAWHAWHASNEEVAVLVGGGGGRTCVFGVGGLKTAGFRVIPRGAWLHYLGVRDGAASEVLRGISDEATTLLLTLAREALSDEELDDDREAPPGAALEALKQHLPQLTNEVIRAGAARVVVQAARAAQELARLQGSSEGGGTGPSCAAVKAALPQLPTDGWGNGYIVPDMARVARAFDGGPIERLSDSSVAWERALDSLARLACFVASRARDDAHRETLVALLEGFAASGLMGRSYTHAKLKVPEKSPLLTRPKDKKAWIASVDGARWLLRMDAYQYDDLKTVHVLLEGQLRVPKDATLEAQRSFTVEDDRAFVAELLRELAARGPAPWDSGAPEKVAQATTLSVAEATLVLMGLPHLNDWQHDFLGKELRAEVGLKVADAKRARDLLKALPDEQRLELVAGAGGVTTPAAFWAPADAEDSVAASLTRTAQRLFGDSVALREDLVTLLDKHANALPLGVRGSLMLLLTAGDAQCSRLTLPAKLPQVGDATLLGSSDDAFGREVIESVAFLVPFLSTQLPVGDAYRSALPALYRRVRALLEDPALLVDLGNLWTTDEKASRALFERVGGKPIEVTLDKEQRTGRDNGTVIALTAKYSVALHVRTARLRTHRAEVQPYFDSSSDGEGGLHVQHVARRAAYLMSDACEALIARIEDTEVEAGGYELNPQQSAKELVTTSAAKLGVDADAAALYLQMLTLPNPNKKLICEVNGWKPARYQQACNALVKQELLIEGKRERAGRDVFLPGAWEKGAGRVPMEAYRAKLYELGTYEVQSLLSVPAHQAFQAAWARWMAGDKPGFEDVEKKPAKRGAKKKS
ncbi:MAG: hypothetical protein KF915_18380 [Polyangiaceae bacterium]|nr:hypothetical protein [Polyangiaceae bacterium]